MDDPWQVGVVLEVLLYNCSPVWSIIYNCYQLTYCLIYIFNKNLSVFVLAHFLEWCKKIQSEDTSSWTHAVLIWVRFRSSWTQDEIYASGNLLTILQTVKSFSCNFSFNQSTFLREFIKITAWVTVMVSYKSVNVFSFHSSFCTFLVKKYVNFYIIFICFF